MTEVCKAKTKTEAKTITKAKKPGSALSLAQFLAITKNEYIEIQVMAVFTIIVTSF